jgi:hypothetical protein
MEIQLAKPRESLAVSRRDLVAWPRAAEASQRAKPTRRVAFRAAQQRSSKQLWVEVPAWRLDQLVPVFFVPVRLLSIPLRAQSGHGRRPCSCRSSRTWLETWWPHRVSFSKHPRVFSRESLRNRFHAARAQSQRARLLRKARKGARSRAMWTRARANARPGEEIPARPFQFVNLRDSIKRGSRIGKSEVLGTICR